MEYREYLKSDSWAKLRDLVRKRANYKCELCGYQLFDVHHIKYPKNGYENDSIENLVGVCRRCHDILHGISNPTANIAVVSAKLGTIENTIREMQQHIAQLDSLDKTVKEIKGGNVLGWSLFRDKGDRWYAIRRIDGQNRSVYIGRDKGKAEEKIKQWESVYLPRSEDGATMESPTIEQIMGFRLVEKTTTTKGHKYKKWYAVHGRQVIYIGRDKTMAETTIRKWLAKHNNQNALVQPDLFP